MAKSKSKVTYYVREWCDKADLDYFGAFVRAYIPFNAWMNDHFKSATTDREKLEKVKNTTNTFRDKIISLLTASKQDQEGNDFRSAIGALHFALEHSTVSKDGERVTFADVPSGVNPTDRESVSRYGFGYEAKYDKVKNTTTLDVRNKSRTSIASMTFNGYPGEEEVCGHRDFQGLTQNQKDELLAVLRTVNPVLRESLLYSGKKKNGGIVCASYRMIEDEKKLAAGIVEILYSLRNGLFHGIIDPNKEANRVYGAAYQVLGKLIDALV